MMKHGMLAIFIGLFIAAHAALAADVTVSASVSAQKVSLNDRLELTISISGPDARKAETPQLNPMNAFHIVGTQQSTEYQFINGKSATIITYIYVLTPRSLGTHDVGGASVKAAGQTFTTQPVRVEVVAGSAQPGQPTAAPEPGKGEGSGNADIFIRTSVDNRQPYVGEQVTLTFELFNRLTLWGDTEFDPPATTGFWAVDLPKITPSTQNANNRIYKYNAVKTALFPTTAGALTIGPASLTYTTGGFFSPQETRTIRTKPISLKARPLPDQGKPGDFTGAVGLFRISAAADKESLPAGDVVKVTITVSGDGNLDLVTAIATPDLTPFRSYDPKVSTQLLNSGFTVGGAKVWEYVLMPKNAGTVVLQPFSLSFFNPKDGKYHTVRTGAITLKVTPGDPNAAAAPGNESRQTGTAVQPVANDINFIKPDTSSLASLDRRLYRNPLYYFMYLLPVGILAAAVTIKRRRDAIERNSGLKRQLNAWKKAQSRLQHAERAEQSGNPADFCGHLSEAVVRFIGDRLNIDTGALTAAALEDRLREAGVVPETAERVRKTLELSDFVRFSSTGADPGLRQKLLQETREILNTLRETI